MGHMAERVAHHSGARRKPKEKQIKKQLRATEMENSGFPYLHHGNSVFLRPIWEKYFPFIHGGKRGLKCFGGGTPQERQNFYRLGAEGGLELRPRPCKLGFLSATEPRPGVNLRTRERSTVFLYHPTHQAERVARHRGLLFAWSAILETHCITSQKKTQKQIKKQLRATKMEKKTELATVTTLRSLLRPTKWRPYC